MAMLDRPDPRMVPRQLNDEDESALALLAGRTASAGKWSASG